MSKQITIRMPKGLLAKWLAALRSGDFKQGKSFLRTEDGYCCLGVLAHIVDGDVRPYEGALLRFDWLTRNGINFQNDCGAADAPIPSLPSLKFSLTTANDSGVSFPEIADAIEACAEGV